MKKEDIKILNDAGFFEIDYDLPLTAQVKIGDVLISTTMYLFDRSNHEIILNKGQFEIMKEEDFTICDLDEEEDMILLQIDAKTRDWFYPEGITFIKHK